MLNVCFRLKTLFLVVAFLCFTVVARGQSVKEIHIRINIAGYLPTDTKVAIVFSNQVLKGNFSLLEKETSRSVYTGKLVASLANGFAPFKNYYVLDFSKVTQEGFYFIELSQSKAKSALLKISASSYHHTPDLLIGFMQQQRCGYNPFFDAVCHQKDGRVMNGPMKDSTFIDVTGGWHDAGDQLKYLITGSNATARMIMAYQLLPKQFEDKGN